MQLRYSVNFSVESFDKVWIKVDGERKNFQSDRAVQGDLAGLIHNLSACHR